MIDKLTLNSTLDREEFLNLISNITEDDKQYLFGQAMQARRRHYGNAVYLRGLIEFTNMCKRNCRYCGIRAANKNADRYRLSNDEILSCCENGYRLGFRTFVLQGGEDDYFTDDRLCGLVSEIKARYPDAAVTLSVGERPKNSYQRLFDAGADRYLLRHETASGRLYNQLHEEMSLSNRKQCLYDLKEIGYQVGAGFMVGLPGQTDEDLVEDLVFLKELSPHMVGIGPFIPQKDTPLANEKSGTAEKTVLLLAVIRLLLPNVLLPATTALGTITPKGREMGLMAGANVLMPNLSPVSVRKKYSLYDGKICTGEEAAECLNCISLRIKSCGLSPDMSRGDFKI
ncbi:MAG: [FeFe] hydrogenase H-cluster radical SAM maturase HydE [Bacillota bacterium]|nr:[FeFe] hydrogenase H-cluster radical SAM maturase HydE [Bacillota bacterium]